MKLTESDIQALKAQEAKDLAIELLLKLEAKEKGLISPGEVQIKELDFELRLREAENEDNRCRADHEQKMKELELQIEKEKARIAEAESHANQVHESFAKVVNRVNDADESLCMQLERATREHNLKVEQLESKFTLRKEELSGQVKDLEQQRSTLLDEINALTELKDEAVEIGQLREEIEQRKKESRVEHAEMEERVAAAEFEKSKKLNEAKRTQELELARLDTQHRKDVLEQNLKAAESILESLEMTSVKKEEWERMHQELQSGHERTDEEETRIRENAREECRREYNITRSDPVDVTELFYREQQAQSEAERLRNQVEKLDAEIRRMREHIEQEPKRISSAVEAAKTPVQNYIEQGPKR